MKIVELIKCYNPIIESFIVAVAFLSCVESSVRSVLSKISDGCAPRAAKILTLFNEATFGL